MRCLLLVVLIALAHTGFASAITVLTEEPVAEFTLPDGSVLKNAYVWRRTSEGLMIIHDGGQFFLNYKTLPDAWRKAYGIDDSVEQVSTASTKRHDQYSLYRLLERIQGLPRATVTYLESIRYEGQADADLLQACTLQALLDGEYTKAIQLNGAVTTYFTNAVPMDLSAFYTGCVACASNGVIVTPCRACSGSGKCVKCAGAGKIKTQFGKRDDEDSGRKKSPRKSDKNDDGNEKDNFSPDSMAFDDADLLHCVNCKGTGKCPACNGSGKRSRQCPECKGKGGVLAVDRIREELAVRIKRLDALRTGLPIAAEPEQADTASPLP